MTPKQRRFVEEYLIDLNATQAAIRAGYSDRNADKIGHQLLGKTGVREAISKAMQERSRQTKISANDVVNELKPLAFSLITNYEFDQQGHVKLAAGADPSAMRAVASIRRRVRKIGTVVETDTEIKLWPKPDALRMLGQHVAMFTDKVAPVNPDGETPYSGGLDRLSEAAIELRAMLDRIRRRGSGTVPSNN